MASKISEAFGSAAAIAKGMSITLGEMMNPTITDLYPDAPPTFQERYRGVHVLQRDENGLEKCVACFLCAAACPADCIYIEAAENTDKLRISGGERYAHVYNIDYSRCIFCGYCVEACPTDAITHGHGFEIASYNRFHIDLPQREDACAHSTGRAFPAEGRNRRRAERALANPKNRATTEGSGFIGGCSTPRSAAPCPPPTCLNSSRYRRVSRASCDNARSILRCRRRTGSCT